MQFMDLQCSHWCKVLEHEFQDAFDQGWEKSQQKSEENVEELYNQIDKLKHKLSHLWVKNNDLSHSMKCGCALSLERPSPEGEDPPQMKRSKTEPQALSKGKGREILPQTEPEQSSPQKKWGMYQTQTQRSSLRMREEARMTLQINERQSGQETASKRMK